MTELEIALESALRRAADAVAGIPSKARKLLSEGGVTVHSVELADTDLPKGKQLKVPAGYAIRFLRHGSNPGARLELSSSGTRVSDFFAPGQVVRGGFDTLVVKLARGGARAGKASFGVFKEPSTDLSEDLIMSAIGPVDLLGATNLAGDPVTYVTVTEDTDPSGANPTGSFDASGWELLRIFTDGNSAGGNATTWDFVPFVNPTYDGTTWHEQTGDVIPVPDSISSGQRYRCFTVPWAGRGLGAFAIRNLLAAGRTGVGLIVQGLR